MKTTITTKDTQEAQRLTKTNDAFNLIWEISQIIRNQQKYGEIKPEEALDQIQEEINESNLLELWT